MFIYLNTDSVQESLFEPVSEELIVKLKSPFATGMLRNSLCSISHVIFTGLPHCRSDVTVFYLLCLDSQMLCFFWL